MLETDCKIPVEPVPIEPPESYTLYGIDHAVQVMRAQGLKKWQICKALHIGDDAWRDAIFEIRKKEMIEEMRGKRLTEEQRRRILMLRDAGITLREIAAEIGCAKSCVSRILGEDKTAEAVQDASECAQSAPAAAVMIMPQTVPDAVTEAVRDSVSTLSTAIDIKLLQIKRMQQEIEDARTKIAELQKWLKEVKQDEDYPIDDTPAAD